jgi:signal transduction histidine kinase
MTDHPADATPRLDQAALETLWLLYRRRHAKVPPPAMAFKAGYQEGQRGAEERDLDSAYRRGVEDQIARDNHSWDVAEAELKQAIRERDEARARAKHLEAALRRLTAEVSDLGQDVPTSLATALAQADDVLKGVQP